MSGIGRFTGKDPWTWQPDDERIIFLKINGAHIRYYFDLKSNLITYCLNNSIVNKDNIGKDIINCLRGKWQKQVGKDWQKIKGVYNKVATTTGIAGGIVTVVEYVANIGTENPDAMLGLAGVAAGVAAVTPLDEIAVGLVIGGTAIWVTGQVSYEAGEKMEEIGDENIRKHCK